MAHRSFTWCRDTVPCNHGDPARCTVPSHQERRSQATAFSDCPTLRKTVAPCGALVAHKGHPSLPEALRAKVRLALNPRSETTDTQGLALASAVLDVLDNLQDTKRE